MNATITISINIDKTKHSAEVIKSVTSHITGDLQLVNSLISNTNITDQLSDIDLELRETINDLKV